MAETDTSLTNDKPAGITCEQYARGEGKRCRHYLPNGACSLPGEFMCTEWLKKNPHNQAARQEDKRPRDLFGNPLPEPSAKKSEPPATSEKSDAAAEQPTPDEHPTPPPRGLTTEDVESFKALGVEVCIHAEDLGDVWLVPTYTGQPRKEITPEHLATIARVLDTFPGSRVTAFDKKPATRPATEGSPA